MIFLSKVSFGNLFFRSSSSHRNIGPVFSIHLVSISMHLCSVCGISCLISRNNMNFICYILKITAFQNVLEKSISFKSAGVLSHFLNFLNIMTLTAGCFYMNLQIAGRNCQTISSFLKRNWSCISWKIEIMMQAFQKSISKYNYAKKVQLFNLIGRWFWEMCCD